MSKPSNWFLEKSYTEMLMEFEKQFTVLGEEYKKFLRENSGELQADVMILAVQVNDMGAPMSDVISEKLKKAVKMREDLVGLEVMIESVQKELKKIRSGK